MANYNPSFTLYHPNAKGTGSAVSLELRPADCNFDGCIFVKIAPQKTVGDARGPNPTFPTFDWEGAIRFRLDFADITQMLQVFRGETESINDGHGLFHHKDDVNTVINLTHKIECRSGYAFDVSTMKVGDTSSEKKVNFFFNSSEALGLSIAFENSLGVICFGVPKVIQKTNE